MMLIIRRGISGAIRLIEVLNKVLMALPSVCAFVMTVMITVNVFLRYGFNSPLAFEFELVQVMMLAFVWLTQAYVFSQEREISVRFIAAKLSRNSQIVIKIIGCAIGVWYFGGMANSALSMAIRSMQLGTRSVFISRFPIGPQQLIIAIGAGLLCLQLLVIMGRHIISLKSAHSASENREKNRSLPSVE